MSWKKVIAEWWDDWEDARTLWLALLALLLLSSSIPLAIYGVHAYLGLGWPLTILLLVNSLLAMMLLGYAAPIASTASLIVATVLWLYNGFLLILLLAGAIYGGYLFFKP